MPDIIGTLTGVFGGGNGLLAGLAGILAVIVAAFLKGRSSGKAAERAKQDKADLKAKDDLLEMHREATARELQAARDSDAEAKRRALEWAKRQ